MESHGAKGVTDYRTVISEHLRFSLEETLEVTKILSIDCAIK